MQAFEVIAAISQSGRYVHHRPVGKAFTQGEAEEIATADKARRPLSDLFIFKRVSRRTRMLVWHSLGGSTP